MTDPQLYKEVGALSARVSFAEARLERIEEKQDRILAILNQGKGSWRTLVALAAISSALGALAVKLAAVVGFFPVR